MTKEITADSLVTESPSPIPVKKQRAPWPQGVPWQPAYPGAPHGRHPIDKGFIKREDAIALGAKDDAPQATPATETPAQNAAPQPEPQPAPQPPPPEPQPQPEPAPDFSDLNAGPSSQADAPGAAEAAAAMGSHKTMGTMFHMVIENILVMLFGEGFRTDEDERGLLTDAWVRCLEFWNMKILNPVEQLAAAYGCYLFGRITFIVAWFKSRRAKKKEKRAEPQREGGKQPHNFAGVDVTPEPKKETPEQPQQPISEAEAENLFGE